MLKYSGYFYYPWTDCALATSKNIMYDILKLLLARTPKKNENEKTEPHNYLTEKWIRAYTCLVSLKRVDSSRKNVDGAFGVLGFQARQVKRHSQVFKCAGRLDNKIVSLKRWAHRIILPPLREANCIVTIINNSTVVLKLIWERDASDLDFSISKRYLSWMSEKTSAVVYSQFLQCRWDHENR